jgi:hypothetical protein
LGVGGQRVHPISFISELREKEVLLIALIILWTNKIQRGWYAGQWNNIVLIKCNCEWILEMKYGL